MASDLSFHQTFPCSYEYIQRILEVADGISRTKEEISEITGIPTGVSSGKVVPHIKYASYMKLVNYVYSLNHFTITLTNLGKVVVENDPYMCHELTLILANYYLTSKCYGADLWNFIYRDLLLKYNNNLSKELLDRELTQKYMSESINLSPFRSTYSGGEFLNITISSIEKRRANINKDFLFLYAYTLLDEWEVLFKDSHGKTIQEVPISKLDEFKWKEGFNLFLNQEFEILSLLETKGIIKLNKQLTPVTIIRLKKSDELLSLIYSELL